MTRFRSRRAMLCASAAAAVLAVSASPPAAMAQDAAPATYSFDIPSQDVGAALLAFGRASRQQLVFDGAAVRGKRSTPLQGDFSTQEGLSRLLEGTGLRAEYDGAGAVRIVSTQGPQGGGAAGNAVQALIVTAQKREEDIQDVPIAISAFSQEDLTRSQVAGGPDLMTQVPNMTFTKTNFSSYSIQLRGIGTQAISATVDPAVAVAFNNTPFIRNRFFEQEFYDLQRVEVLRGPQGTLYGRNATAGVVNLISAKPKFYYEAKAAADVANYSSSRIEGMVNLPLVEDTVALRVAGAWTKRDGYSTNELTGKPIDGRDLWSTRVSLRFAPNDRLDANLIWEHFEEDDDRIRSGKQLCHTDVVTNVAGFDVPNFYQGLAEYGLSQVFSGVQPSFSQGCKPASLYSPDSFEKTNSLALPYFVPLGAIGLPIAEYPSGHPNSGRPIDPYTSRTQSTDLRVIEAAVDPSYRAKTDVVELQFSYDLTDALTLSSETSWASDFIFSTQDYNRFAGAPNAWRTTGAGGAPQYLARGILDADGVFCDPQIGCSDRLVAMDLSTAQSTQFSQELRLASDFDGPFNFSLGANFLRYDTEDKYYVFINSISLISAYLRNGINNAASVTTPYEAGVTDNRDCLTNGMAPPEYTQVQPILLCTYIDPNPITSLNDLGHNYFLSRNPYKLISYAAFGEAYYNITDTLKITGGLRWTVDKKEAPRIPSWLLASNTVGYPVAETVQQEWRKPTGRLAIDWKPDLSFTDQTLVYASYSHGYKAGGMNPPPYGKAVYGFNGGGPEITDRILASSALHPKTFEPEYVDAFELGSKNTLLDGSLTVNLAAFYYDYQAYQLSQIIDRSAVTDNFDADVWGLELETDWRPMENLRLGLKLGYEKTKVADGEQAIDVMDRTAGREGWLLHKPFPSIPSNCVLPEWLFVGNPQGYGGSPNTNPWLVNVGGKGGAGAGGCENAYLLGLDPATGAAYTPFPFAPPGNQVGEFFRVGTDYTAWSTDLADYPCLAAVPTNAYPGVDPECLAAMSNNGEGFFKDLSGNELPNAPYMTATITADYTIPLPNDWLATLHTDLYYQSEAWTRIFNTEGYDKLKAYTNVNLAAIFTNEEAGWKVMAYVKNVFDRDSITGAFLNSDDSGLTTNVFLTEPRLYGIRITKDFNGGPWWTGANPDHEGPFPLTVELGGQIQRTDAPYETLHAAWVDALPAIIAPENVQNRDLDWGDDRSLKLTYQPAGSPWKVSASVRYGRTNTDMTRTNAADVYVIEECARTFPFLAFYMCDPASPYYSNYERFRNLEARAWSDAESNSREEHQFADFVVGRELGMGGDLGSTVSLGLRYANFEFDTSWAVNAQTGWDIPDGWGELIPGYGPNLSSMERRHVDLAAKREFEGWGPMLFWSGDVQLWRSEAAGRLALDWTVGGGALFGDRKTQVSGEDVTQLHEGEIQFTTFAGADRSYITGILPEAGPPTVTPISITRSEEATVPVVDLSLGFAYEAGRVKVSTGYRWERYFDVLDVGQDQAKDADRTLDGPYFKIAVGFGG